MTTTQPAPLESSSLWAAMKASYDSGNRQWIETTEAQYLQQENILPPISWGLYKFLASGEWSLTEAGAPIYAVFSRANGRCFAAYMTMQEYHSNSVPRPLTPAPFPPAQPRFKP
jgi:hypothetical protein